MTRRPDPTAFTGTAGYYARYRVPYPAALLARIRSRYRLDGAGRLLDLGCGTGQLSLPLAPDVAEIVGLDPEPDMLNEADAEAARAGVTNARWLVGRDSDLDHLFPERGAFRLVTIGRAFHRMAQEATLRSLDRLVETTGGVVLVGDREPIWHGSAPWQLLVRQTIRRWLGQERRDGAGFVQPHEPFEVYLARSAFRETEFVEYEWRRDVTVDEIVGYLYSTSYCSLGLLGDQRNNFERELRQALLALDPQGLFTEEVSFNARLAWRPTTPGPHVT